MSIAAAAAESTPSIRATIDLMKTLHKGQRDKAGEPYWLHPIAVMELLPADATDEERRVALLHDTIEDCGIDGEDLRRRGYSTWVIERVQWLSRPKKKGVSYLEWIRQFCAIGDRCVLRVKIADVTHNSNPERRSKLSDMVRAGLPDYDTALGMLNDALMGLPIKGPGPTLAHEPTKPLYGPEVCASCGVVIAKATPACSGIQNMDQPRPGYIRPALHRLFAVKEKLIELTEPSRDIDKEVWGMIIPIVERSPVSVWPDHVRISAHDVILSNRPHVTSSIDAAIAFVDAVMPGRWPEMLSLAHARIADDTRGMHARRVMLRATPMMLAREIVLVAIEALLPS